MQLTAFISALTIPVRVTRHIWAESCKNLSSGIYRQKKAQISLRIRAVWSGPLLSFNRITGYYRMFELRAKARNDTLRNRGLIWICAFCACSKTFFRLTRLILSGMLHEWYPTKITVYKYAHPSDLNCYRKFESIQKALYRNHWMVEFQYSSALIYIYKI